MISVSEYSTAIVRFSTPSGQLAGLGVLVGQDAVVTCAHVVNAALGRPLREQTEPAPPIEIVVRFPLLDTTPARVVTQVAAWIPPARDGAGGDVAGLLLGESAPLAALPARLSGDEDVVGQSLRVFGYPGTPPRADGVWVDLAGMGEVGRGLIQVESRHDQSIKAQPGFSGSPVWSHRGRVAGLLHATPFADEDERDAYLIPPLVVANAWPDRFDYLLIPPNPYRGLEPFTTDDADVFFGREAEIVDLQNRVRAQPVTVVVGPSGVGKSSLVRAGLVPRLQSATPWTVAVCRPGQDPWHRLAASLLEAQVAGEPAFGWDAGPPVTPNTLERQLDQLHAHGLDGVGRYLRSRGRPLLVVIDQFEEALVASPPDTELLDLLLPPPRDASDVTRVVLTLRSDFLPALLDVPGMGNDRVGSRLFFLSGLTDANVREAVQAPAETRAVGFQPGLLDTIVADTSSGALPLLEFTLTRLWGSQERKTMTFAGYRAMGGVGGALDHFAAQQLAQLDSEVQTVVDRLLLRLLRTQPGDAQLTTRNRVYRSELSAEHWQVLQHLADARLVVTDVDADAGSYAELAHESLITAWPRLSQVRADNIAFLAWLSAIERRAADEDPLPEARIAEAQTWLDVRPDDIPTPVRDFIATSQATVDSRVRQLESSTREALAARREAEEARSRADALRLAAQSELAYRGRGADPASALSLAVESLRRRSTPEGISAIRQAMSIAGKQQYLQSHVGATSHVAYVAGGSQVASAGVDGFVRISDAVTGAPMTALHHDSRVVSMCASSRGDWLAVGLQGGTAMVYVTRDYSQEAVLLKAESPVAAVTIDQRSNLLAAGDHAGRVCLYELGSDKRRLYVHVRPPVSAMALGPGRRLAVGGAHGLRVYDVSTGGTPTATVADANVGDSMAPVFESRVPVRALAFSGDGKLGIAADDHSVHVLSFPGEFILRHRGAVVALDFSPDGHHLATGSEDGTARVLDVETGAEITRLAMAGPVRAVAFAADTFRVACAGDDRTARVFEAATGEEVVRARHSAPLTAVASSPDGRHVLSGSSDGAVLTFSAANGSERARLVHDDGVRVVQFDEGATHVACASLDGTARVFSADTGQEMLRTRHDASVWCATFVQEGRVLASGAADGTVRLASVRAGEPTRVHQHASGVMALAPSRGDSTLLASGHTDGSVFVRQLSSNDEPTEFSAGGRVFALVMAADGRRVISGADDGTCRVFDIREHRQVASFACRDVVRSLAVSLDDRTFAVGSWDGSATVYEMDSLQRLARVQHVAPVTAVALSADGAMIASASADGVANVTDVASGRTIAVIQHEAQVTAVAFSDEGSLLATGGVDRLAVVTDVEEGLEVTRLVHDGPVASLSFSPGGRRLATGSSDRTARVFTLDTTLMLHEAEALLTEEQRVRSIRAAK